MHKEQKYRQSCHIRDVGNRISFLATEILVTAEKKHFLFLCHYYNSLSSLTLPLSLATFED